jgi:hypothetical protein
MIACYNNNKTILAEEKVTPMLNENGMNEKSYWTISVPYFLNIKCCSS